MIGSSYQNGDIQSIFYEACKLLLVRNQAWLRVMVTARVCTMAVLAIEKGELYYEVSGREDGYPVLLFAPGFLSSRIERWRSNPSSPGVPQAWRDPIPVLEPYFRVIALDVRNAGRSWAEIGPDYDWGSYTADHLKLLRHLGVERCHVMGGCIGVSFALALEETAPGTVSSQVLQNPIGLSDRNRAAVDEEVEQWMSRVRQRADVDQSFLDAAGRRMFAGDFIFSITRETAGRCNVPTLLMPGDDTMHPSSISADLERLTRAEVIMPWKGPAHRDAAIERTCGFLREHTPKVAA
jgi:pimeloyl-ACP methyl ester carboxylesterase